MNFHSLLITGGAGFVGSNLAVSFRKQFPDLRVTVLDNLKRRGSELNAPRLTASGVRFVHGDIRCEEDLAAAFDFDLLIDCAAEPSVQAGQSDSPVYVINTNLLGTVNCLEAARKQGAGFLFLSTSRVYPIKPLNELSYREEETRYRWDSFSAAGVGENFPLEGARSFYGASKLACEQLIEEYAYHYGMKAMINRCGVLAGPWQMGKVDQGVAALWVARHFFGRPLTYIGFGGTGKQVRDLLHIDDLYRLLVLQMNDLSRWDGSVYNIGGGAENSVSLQELTAMCQSMTGVELAIESTPQTHPADVRIYITDAQKAQDDFGWRPQRTVEDIVRDIHRWLSDHAPQLRRVFE